MKLKHFSCYAHFFRKLERFSSDRPQSNSLMRVMNLENHSGQQIQNVPHWRENCCSTKVVQIISSGPPLILNLSIYSVRKKYNNVNPKFNLNDWFADKFHGSETVMYVSSTNCYMRRQHLPALVLIIGPFSPPIVLHLHGSNACIDLVACSRLIKRHM